MIPSLWMMCRANVASNHANASVYHFSSGLIGIYGDYNL